MKTIIYPNSGKTGVYAYLRTKTGNCYELSLTRSLITVGRKSVPDERFIITPDNVIFEQTAIQMQTGLGWREDQRFDFGAIVVLKTLSNNPTKPEHIEFLMMRYKSVPLMDMTLSSMVRRTSWDVFKEWGRALLKELSEQK